MNLAATLAPFLHYRRWCIAYSGGVDSHVLLHAVVQLRQAMASATTARESIALPPLVAIHVDHQLNPRAADWVAHCRKICAALGVELIVETVHIQRAGGLGLEAAARAARYAAFEKIVGAEQLLLQAHHRDDQIETLLLRLLRGSGIAGLAAIPAQRSLGAGELLRPFLQPLSPATRADIVAYAQQHRLQWIHDDSNDNEHFDRNFLRSRVTPLLAERWPAYRDTLQRVIDNATDADALLKELAAQDFIAAGDDDGTLKIDLVRHQLPARQRNLIIYWLQQLRLPLPSRAQMTEVLALIDARVDAEPCVSWPGAELHRFRDRLYALKPLAPLPADFDNEWRPPRPLRIDGLGELCANATTGAVLRADRIYRVRNRRGGERCQPAGRAHSQTLKKLLQERAVPPWLRDRLPLIYCGEQLAAVGDIWICEGFQTPAGASGWQLEWCSSALPH